MKIDDIKKKNIHIYKRNVERETERNWNSTPRLVYLYDNWKTLEKNIVNFRVEINQL